MMRAPARVQGSSPSVFCPECGAPAPFRGTTVTLVCEYCSSTIVRTGIDLQLVGRVSALVDNGSPVLLGSRGRHNGVPFEVSGRLQVIYGRGAWNEWFLSFADGTFGWLADALGQFAVVRPRDAAIVAGRVPQHGWLVVGSVLTLDGIALTVVDKRAASYRGSEGELPFVAVPGVTFHSADLRGERGEYVTLDWGDRSDHARPVPYFGSATTLADLGLYPLRRFQGWQPPTPGAPAQRGATR